MSTPENILGSVDTSTEDEAIAGLSKKRIDALDKMAADPQISAGEGAMRLFLASLPAIIGGAIAGKEGLTAGAAGGATGMKLWGELDEHEAERKRKLGEAEFKTLGEQMKPYLEAKKQKQKFALDVEKEKQKSKLQEDEEVNVANRTKDIKKEIAAAGKSSVSVNMPTGEVVGPEAAKEIGRNWREKLGINLPDETIASMSYQAVKDYPNIVKAKQVSDQMKDTLARGDIALSGVQRLRGLFAKLRKSRSAINSAARMSVPGQRTLDIAPLENTVNGARTQVASEIARVVYGPRLARELMKDWEQTLPDSATGEDTADSLLDHAESTIEFATEIRRAAMNMRGPVTEQERQRFLDMGASPLDETKVVQGLKDELGIDTLPGEAPTSGAVTPDQAREELKRRGVRQ